MKKREWRAPLLATAVFSVCFALTVALVRWHAQQNETIARQQLALAGNALAERLSLRINSFNNALLGLRGALAGHADRANRYNAFDRVVDLMRQYPGALSVGYAERVSQDHTPGYLAQLAMQHGRPIPLHSTEVNNGDRFIVAGVSGSMALGTDLAGLGPVRAAGMRATWLNEAVLSPPVAGPENAPPSFYLLLPTYAEGVDPKDSMLRHEQTVGWLFIHLSGERLLQGISDRVLHLRLIDHQEDEEVQTVVFDSAAIADNSAASAEAAPPLATLQLDKKVGGRAWQLLLTPQPEFQDGLGLVSPAVGLGFGFLVSVLAAMLTYTLLAMQQRASRLAERMTRALRTSEQRQRAILENASVGIIFTSDQKTAHCNPKAAEIFGWSNPQAMLGLAGSVYWPSLQDYAQVGERAGPALSAGAVFEAERPMRRKDGSSFLAQIRAKAIDPAAITAGTIWIIEDVTEQRHTEDLLTQRTNSLQQTNQELGAAMQKLTETQQELVRSEKLAGLGNMVVGVAHEMNTPIGICLMAASTLNDSSKTMQDTLASGLRRTALEQFIDDNLKGSALLIDNLTRMARLIKSFKRVAVQQSASQRSQFDLAEIVDLVVNAARMRHAGADLVIEAQVPAGIVLDSYLDELDQILSSLVGNAIGHGLEGRAQGRVVVGAAVDASQGLVRLTVEDNGKGMAAEVLPRIFDPFFTTKLGVGDSGLGLNITYNQVTGVLGGTIDVRSTVNVGTCFTVTLPLCAP